MRRFRAIAGTPFRSASEAWVTTLDLVNSTLERSSEVPDGSCKAALSALSGIMPAMITTGVFSDYPIVVAAGPFQVALTIATGDASFTVDENLSPVPGGAAASAAWKMYIPARGAFAGPLTAIVTDMRHASTATAPELVEEAKASFATLDEKAFRSSGGR